MAQKNYNMNPVHVTLVVFSFNSLTLELAGKDALDLASAMENDKDDLRTKCDLPQN